MRKLISQKGNVTVALLVVILIIVLIVGVGVFYYIMNPQVLDKIRNTSTNTNEITTETTVAETTLKDKKIEFSDFSKIFANTTRYEEILIDNEYSYIDSVYLEKGSVYITINENIITEKNNLANLKKDKKNFDGMENDITAYKLPLTDIILMSYNEYGQDGSGVLFFENSKGEVYYINTSQLGAIGYSFFNENGEINIKKSKLANIVDFRSYGVDGWSIFAIDINGKEIEFSEMK